MGLTPEFQLKTLTVVVRNGDVTSKRLARVTSTFDPSRGDWTNGGVRPVGLTPEFQRAKRASTRAGA